MNVQKSLSAVVAVGYLIVAYLYGGPGTAPKCVVFLFLPMACIWYSDELGEFTGNWGGQFIDATSPGWAVALVGWLLLLLPPLAILALPFVVGS